MLFLARRKLIFDEFVLEGVLRVQAWYSSVIAQKASGSAIEWAGGVGYTRETGIEKYWRDSKSESTVPPFGVHGTQL